MKGNFICRTLPIGILHCVAQFKILYFLHRISKALRNIYSALDISPELHDELSRRAKLGRSSPSCRRQVIWSQRREPLHFNTAPSFLRKSLSILIPLFQSCLLIIFLIFPSDSEASPGSDGEGLAERTSCSFGSPAELAPVPCEPSPPASMEEIQVELQCADLWKRFHDIGTEMIITKAGR